jgi:predicted PurR-regulated permease PerM
MIQIHPNTIRQILFLALLLCLGFVISKELYFLLLPLLGAITFYVLLRNYMIALITKFKWKKSLAALTLIVLTLLLIVGPFAWLINYGYHQLFPFLQQPEVLKEKLTVVTDYIDTKFGINIISETNLAKANTEVMGMAQKILGSTLNSLGILVMMFFILYFMLIQTSDVEFGMRKYIPFTNKNVQTLIQKTRALVYSNAIGIPIVAVIQGLAGLIGYWMFGVPDFILFGILTAIASVIPVVGTMLIYAPLMIYLLSMNQTWQGVAVGIWGFVVIGGIDNVARFLLQKHLSDVHPLITIFGVIMGLNLFGFIGIIFGPIIISIFALLVEIYIDEYGKAEVDKIGKAN